PIDCGNSGTTIRLLCGLLAGHPFESTLVGDASLSSRPMMRVIDPLRAMGAEIDGEHRGDEIVPPIRIAAATTPLIPIRRDLEIASAQVKTAIVLAGLYADGETRITEPGPSRDHTERMLAYLGAPIFHRGRTVAVDTRSWGRRLA